MEPGRNLCGWIIFWILLLTGISPSHAGASAAGGSGRSPSVEELRPLIQEALDRNPEVEAAREQVRALKERIPQARALDDPEAKIQLWNTPESLNLTRTATTIYGLAQRFPFPGTLAQQEQLAAREADQAVQRLAAKEREIIAAVKAAYYEFFYAHQALAIHHERVDLLKRFFEIANAKFRVGQGTQVDVLKAQVELSKLLQHLPLLEQQLKTAKARLNTLLNRDPLAPLGVPGEPAARRLGSTLEGLQDRALRLRPELREADMAIAQSEAAIRLAHLQYYPKLRIEVQRWQNFNASDGFGGNFTLNIPFAFWTKPKYDAQVREAAAQVETARSRKQTLENLTRFQVQDLIAQVRATEQIVDLYATTVLPQALQTRDAAMAGYRTGRTDFLDLIEADRAVLTYRLEYARAKADVEQQLANLERVVGTEL
jgi:outer membrane protein, heavy metal efflux system